VYLKPDGSADIPQQFLLNINRRLQHFREPRSGEPHPPVTDKGFRLLYLLSTIG
jgi:hypothetical protein